MEALHQTVSELFQCIAKHQLCVEHLEIQNPKSGQHLLQKKQQTKFIFDFK